MAETENDEESEDENMEMGIQQYSSPSGASRAGDVIGTPCVDSHPAGDSMDTDAESDTHRNRGSQDASRSNPSRSARTISDPDLTQVVTRGSDISVDNADMYPPSLGEEVVNMAAVTFLRVLTMWCPEVELEWEVRRKAFETQLGEASIRAHTDGCLSSEDDANKIHGIVEVKPFPVAKDSEETLMQMDLEMLAFILYYELNWMPKRKAKA